MPNENASLVYSLLTINSNSYVFAVRADTGEFSGKLYSSNTIDVKSYSLKLYDDRLYLLYSTTTRFMIVFIE